MNPDVTLFDDQKEWSRSTVRAFEEGDGEQGPFQRVLSVAATGAGKTIMGAGISYYALKRWEPPKVLFLADTDELIGQAQEKIHWATNIPTDREKGRDSASLKSRIVVGSIQTLQKAARLNRYPQNHFGLVIADEAHLSMADGWQRVLNHFDAGGARSLGITATPFRGDDKNLWDWWQFKGAEIGLFELIEKGRLSPIRVKTVPLDIEAHFDADPDAEDIDDEQVRHAIEPAFDAIIDAWEQHGEGRKTLWFLPGCQASQRFTQKLLDRGHTAAHVDGTSKNRKGILAGYATNRFKHLCNSDLLMKGYDQPDIECVVILKLTRSRVNYQQMVGRGTRVFKGKDCIAEGTMILTDHGLVPIERVTKKMKVWDGISFVNHGGAIYKGERDTITYAGLTATTDHQVWTEHGWKSFGICAAEGIPIAVTGFEGTAVREAEGHFRRDSPRKKPDHDADAMRLRTRIMEATGICPERDGRMSKMWQQVRSASVAAWTFCGGKIQMPESKRPELHALRRPWDRISFREREVGSRVDDGKPRATSGNGDRPNRQRWSLRTGKSSLVNKEAKQVSHPEKSGRASVACFQDEISRNQICRRDSIENVLTGDDGIGDHRTLEPAVIQTKRRVWDILDAGPFHRFTAGGLLVHNCMLLLDFLFQFGELGVCRPGDLIARNPKQAREIQDRLNKGQALDLRDARDLSESEAVQRLVKGLLSRRGRRGETYDARDAAAVLNAPELLVYEPEQRWELLPPTPRQREILARKGLDPKSIKTRGEASNLMTFLIGRAEKDRATLKQVVALGRLGVQHAENMSFAEASAMMDLQFSR